MRVKGCRVIKLDKRVFILCSYKVICNHLLRFNYIYTYTCHASVVAYDLMLRIK
jgi:hypothetical protein